MEITKNTLIVLSRSTRSILFSVLTILLAGILSVSGVFADDAGASLSLSPITVTTSADVNAFVDIPAENFDVTLNLATLTIPSQPSSGEVIILDAVNGILAYLPDNGFVGQTSFDYQVCDVDGTCGLGIITVDVVGVNSAAALAEPATTDNIVSGDLMQWHRVSLTFDGPQLSETDAATFWNYRLLVTFTNGQSSYVVPGFFAADGNAANTSATSGTKWRVHFTPDAIGTWTYTVSFRTGNRVSISLDPNAGTATSFDGATGSFNVVPSTAPESDFRYHGTLRYVGGHYMQFAGSAEYFLKAGADSPENFLAYSGFDGTSDTGGTISNFLHSYTTHISDWRVGDPTWGTNNRGQGIIGALNYLADQGVNSIYFITYNIDGGDGADTWPWTSSNARETFDVSKLDQWEIVFSHMTARGIQLHFLTQETENDGDLGGNGSLNDIRRLYYREMVARFSHHPAVQWNIGEENNNTPQQRSDFAAYIRSFDPYNHPITVHSGFNAAPSLYNSLYGNQNYEATSIQGDSTNYNNWAIDFRNSSAAAGRPFVIYGDEQAPPVNSNMGNVDELRRNALWGNLMGGGAGVEWYFGYQGDFGDLQTENFRVAQPIWEDTAFAVNFFQTYLPFSEMTPDNSLVNNGRAFAKIGDTYAVYLPNGGSTSLSLPNNSVYDVYWYNPRTGGTLQTGNVVQVTGPGAQSLGNPPSQSNQDWAVLVRVSGSAEGNSAPTLNAIADMTMQDGTQSTVAITATDTDSNTLTLSVTAPSFVTLQDNGNGTGTLTLAPPVGSAGTYPITVNVSDNEGGGAQEGFNLVVGSDDVEPAPTGNSVTRFVLINAVTDQDITVLAEGSTINLGTIGTDQLAIRAETSPNVVGSVVFGLNTNQNYQTESVAPYSLSGDNNGDYGVWTPTLGAYTLTATPYSGASGGGSAGTPLTIHFTVVNSGINLSPTISSIANLTLTLNNPVNVTISANDPEGQPLTISATGVPGYLTFTNNGNDTASITGTASQTGTSAITVTASDGNASSSQNFSITVTEAGGGGGNGGNNGGGGASNDPNAVSSFTLIDAPSGTSLQTVQNGATIDMDTLSSTNLAVRAEISAPTVEEVVFQVNGRTVSDTTAPFAVPVALGDNNITATPYLSGSVMDVNYANYGYSANRISVTIPANAVRLNPGDNIQSAINSRPAGTAFVLSAGIYRLQSINPKDGNQFYGEPGAIISGARLLTGFQQQGNAWYVTGQTQSRQPHGDCFATGPRCNYPEDLFIDNVPMRHVASLNDVVAGTWYFDYNADRIYIGNNPNGRVVETSVTEYAFQGSADNVLITNLTIEKYANRAQSGAIHGANSFAWTIQNSIIRLNHAAGIRIGNSMHVVNNLVIDNGQMGVTGIGDNVLVEWNEIARNNFADFSYYWEAGGTKFVLTNNLMVRHNYVHNNYGPGLWTDIDNVNSTYDSNLVMYNYHMGIFHEISHDAVIKNNVSMYNSIDDAPWLYGAQILISTSRNGEVFNNRVVVSAEGSNGIAIIQQNRGSGRYGTYYAQNNTIYDNEVIYLGNSGRSGAAADWNSSSFYQAGNSFSGNTYYTNYPNNDHWSWNGYTNWTQFRSRGQDTNGQLLTDIDDSVVVGTPLTIQFTLTEDIGNEEPTAPEAPTALAVQEMSSTEIELTWVDNSDDETLFEIERDGVILAPVLADTVLYLDSSLTGDTSYCYRVRAVNADGESDWTEEACATTSVEATAPVAPTSLGALTMGTSQIQITWADNASDETLYEVERAGLVLTSVEPNTVLYLDTALTAETNYCYRVRAVNDIGTSDWSNEACAMTQAEETVPNAPSNLGAVSVSTSEIQITWADNASDESSYEIERAGVVVTSTLADTIFYLDSALTPDTNYCYRVRAVNAVGASAWSNEACANTQAEATVPAAPSGLGAQEMNSSQIQITWVDNSADETLFEIERDGVMLNGVLPNSMLYVDSTLSADTSYCYRVRAVNNAGASEWTSQACATTQSVPVMVPNAPSSLSAQTMSSTEIQMTWLDNASNESMVEVERDGVVITPLPANSVVYFDSSLSADTNYCYRVRAVNNDGASEWSNQSCATTQSESTGGNNQAPTIETPGDQVNNVGDSVSLQLQYNDPEAGVLRFTASDLPDGLTIDSDSAMISGTPTVGGARTVTVTAIDPEGLTAETSFNWTINGDNGGGGGNEEAPNTVTALVLVNADTDQDIMVLSNGVQLDLATLPSRNLNIRARVSSGVESVRFGLNSNANFSTENEAPYSLAGDNSGDYSAWSPNAGSYTVTGTPYSDNNARGTRGNNLSINFTIVNNTGGNPGGGGGNTAPNSVTGLVLVNADTEQDIMVLTSGMQINLNNLPTRNLNIRANVTTGVESVRFGLNSNANFITENEAPYAMAGDNSGNYNAWSPGVGSYTVTATPFTGDSLNGTAGNAMTVSFTIVNNTAVAQAPAPQTNVQQPTLPPVPTQVPSASNSGLSVTRFVLVDARNNQDIMVITNGQTIDLSSLPTRQLNIRIDVAGNVDSLAISWNGASVYYENSAPYAVHRDTNGNYNSWRPSRGSYSITATPYSRDNGNGNAGTPLSISFSFTNN